MPVPEASPRPALPEKPFVEVWRGSVAAWECDEMGHLNVRFYLSKFGEGLAGLARRLGMPGAFRPEAASTLLTLSHHLRFLKEARAGAPLRMDGAVTAFEDAEAEALLILRHGDSGEPAASALIRLAHVEPLSGRPFVWPERSRRLASELLTQTPAFAGPRSLQANSPSGAAALKAADRLGLVCIGRGAVRPEDADPFGRLRVEGFIGRVSDGVPGLARELRAEVQGASQAKPARLGGAVLEYRLHYLLWPKVGDHLEVRSGLKAVGEKTHTFVHWILDPVTGQPYATAEAVAVTFDLDARRIVPIPPDARKSLSLRAHPGLSA